MKDKLSILLIEDNEDDYMLTKEMIDRRSSLVWKRSVPEALDALETESFDAILLDLGMPHSDGIETFENLVQGMGHIPVIVVLTGSDDEDLARSALQHGAQDYLIKGRVDKDLLARALRYSIERHRIDTELRMTNDELVAINAKLIAARDEAHESNRLKTEFLANVSHEIRTPMSGIVSFAELLSLETDLPADVKEMIDCVYTSSLRLVTTLNDLLDLSKLDAGRMIVRPEKFAIRDLMNEIVQTVSPTATRKNLAIKLDVADDVPLNVLTDQLRLKQIVLNFAHNAVKFTSKGDIKLKVEFKDPQVLKVVVTDTGIGIAENVKNRIFQPFMQADGSTTRKYGGSGLGLSIAERLAELLGGEIGFESVEGAGSSFWCILPLEQHV
ncbi:MAG: response regulator [Cyanobacteria bacterium SZAS-4]|nr:response regulator [Cyanobacteria bacterium SZAS-4]